MKQQIQSHVLLGHQIQNLLTQIKPNLMNQVAKKVKMMMIQKTMNLIAIKKTHMMNMIMNLIIKKKD